jgi:aminoglycoside phosphotransferase (APT) family kinase protein
MSDSQNASGHAEQVELAAKLSDYLSEQVGRRVAVNALTRISDGWESDVYAFDAPEWHAGEHVLRLYFGANSGQTALHEYRSLDLLKRANYPVPQVNLVEQSPQPLGRSFLMMERVEGGSLGKLWRSPDEAVRQREMVRFCELFAQLHTLEWRHLPGAEHVPSVSIPQQLDYWNGFVANLPSNSFKRAMAWLYEAGKKVSAQPSGLVHWDFHHENILVGADGRAWVIDWTQFQATDIRFDVAWTLTLLASERDLETAEAVRAGYYAQRGWDAAAVEEEMRFFEAAASAKRLVAVVISLSSGADTMGMRPGAEAIMSSRLSRFAIVYRRWLELTQTPLPDVETLLAAHL